VRTHPLPPRGALLATGILRLVRAAVKTDNQDEFAYKDISSYFGSNLGSPLT
jgi:hypothetical protein